MANEKVQFNQSDEKEAWETPCLVKGDVALDTMLFIRTGGPDGGKLS